MGEKRSCRVVTKSRVFNRVYFSVLRNSIKENNNSLTVWGRAMSFPSSSLFPWKNDIVGCNTTTLLFWTAWHCDTLPRDTLMVHAVTMWAVDGIEEREQVTLPFGTINYHSRRKSHSCQVNRQRRRIHVCSSICLSVWLDLYKYINNHINALLKKLLIWKQ